MDATMQVRSDRVNPNVLDASRAHIRIRRAEGVDPDDLVREVTKWWDWEDRLEAQTILLATPGLDVLATSDHGLATRSRPAVFRGSGPRAGGSE